jgi:hypothetical protein
MLLRISLCNNATVTVTVTVSKNSAACLADTYSFLEGKRSVTSNSLSCLAVRGVDFY